MALITRIKLLLIILLTIPVYTYVVAQTELDQIKASLTIDSEVFDGSNANKLDEFLTYFINENSYQESFENLKQSNFKADFQLEIDGLREQKLVSSKGQANSFLTEDCRTVNYTARDIQGIYFRKSQKLKFFTAKLMESFLAGLNPDCQKIKNKKEPRIDELIELLLNPGTEADLQFIGYKTNLFSEEISKFYDYQIYPTQFGDHQRCIAFELVLKPQYKKRKKKKTIIKSIKSYYDVMNNRSLGKEMVIEYKTPLQNFDIQFTTELELIKGRYLPKKITYDGTWSVIPHRTEFGTFTIEFNNLLP